MYYVVSKLGRMARSQTLVPHFPFTNQPVVYIFGWPTYNEMWLLKPFVVHFYYVIPSPTVDILVQVTVHDRQIQQASPELPKYIVAIDNSGNEIPFSAQVPTAHLPTSNTIRDRTPAVISDDESTNDSSK